MLITVLVNDEGDYKTKDKQRRTIKIRSQKEIKKKCVCPFLVWTLLFVQCKNDLFIYLSEQVAAHQKDEDRKGKYKYISQQVCWICWTCYVCHGVYISGVLMRLIGDGESKFFYEKTIGDFIAKRIFWRIKWEFLLFWGFLWTENLTRDTKTSA